MSYDVDYDYEFQEDEDGVPFLPQGMVTDGDLYVLPNGRYLPRGCYRTEDGGHVIYEPPQLSPLADLLAGCSGE